MANIGDNIGTVLSSERLTGQEVAENDFEGGGGEGSATVEVISSVNKADNGVTAEHCSGDSDKPQSTDAADLLSTNATTTTATISTVTRPSLVPLGGSSSASTGSSVPQPKKFSSVNINKKFLEKNSSASGSAPATSSSTMLKPSGPVSRPPTSTTTFHSRLVTTKLTTNPQSSSTPGPGWSRPSSATPPVASGTGASTASMPNGASPAPQATASTGSSNASSTTPAINTASSSAPQLPHAGKVIQPQPRAAITQSTLGSQKNSIGSGPPKLAWGNVKANVAAISQISDSNDFPTAAEVAQSASSSRKGRLPDPKTSDSVTSNKQTRNEEADTFRGVHLDPNAHHWDEMEEDDDNFLDGVLEFGDGRQYKIETSKGSQPSPPHSSPSSRGHSKSRADENQHSRTSSMAGDQPVSKEERFGDDFDRSWPRTRLSPPCPQGPYSASGHPPSSGASAVSGSPVLSHQHLSPQEPSRVLFNERSNRLEPYTSDNRSHTFRSGHGQPFSGRRSDYSTSPTESRVGRDLPPHHGPVNVQLLQKLPSEGPRSRSSGFGPGPSSTPGHDRHRDPPFRRDKPGSTPFNTFGPSGSTKDRESTSEHRGRRSYTDMGAPLPIHARDSGRQLPPHLGQDPQLAPLSQGRLSHSKFPPSQPSDYESTPPSTSTSLPSGSPALSHASAAPSTGPPALSAPELDEARRDLMHTAAERAKQRRQLEEEAREKEKERARQKAVELEHQMKAMEAEKLRKQQMESLKASEVQDKEVISLIEDAARNVEQAHAESPSGSMQQPPHSPSLRRPVSLKGHPRQPSEPGRPAVKRLYSPLATTPGAQAESWRSRGPPSAGPIQQSKPFVPTFALPPPSPLEQIESSLAPEESLEVVDFSDLGKFVGVPEQKDDSTGGEKVRKSSRPVASDFFEDGPPTPRADNGLWRRKSVLDATTFLHVQDLPATVEPIKFEPAVDHNSITDDAMASAKHTTSSDHTSSQVISLPPATSQQRTPRAQASYRESTMSALDDAMSRIKGAMQSSSEVPKDLLHHKSFAILDNSSKPTASKDRWVPPSLRTQHVQVDHSREPLVTRAEPPQSPFPERDNYRIRMSKVSIFRDAPRWKPFTKPWYWTRLSVRSCEPFGDRGHRRDLSLTDYLFGKPHLVKGKARYRVVLPRSRAGNGGFRVLMPSNPNASKTMAGTFGRSTDADSLMSWRKPIASSTTPSIKTEQVLTQLDTTSRSPPPDFSSGIKQPADSKTDAVVLPKTEIVFVKARTEPKMPAGSSVAFYRNSRIDVVEEGATTSVNFIVGSELEDLQTTDGNTISGPPQISVSSHTAKSLSTPNHKTNDNELDYVAVNGIKSPSPGLLPTLTQAKIESKSSDDTADHGPITPPNHHSSSTWTSPLSFSAADSSTSQMEHLRTVWTQAEDKARLPVHNSLKGIADDLAPLPFTLQDMKSEDGGTPPPSMPSRREVTRNFQMVPPSQLPIPSSSSSTHQATPLSPSTSAPIVRPQNYPYPMPTSNPSMRAPYPPYHSPIMNPTATQPMMYPSPMTSSPVPGRMGTNSHTPYSQNLWMPNPAPPGQNHAGFMRPLTSPYPGHLVPYPASGTPTMYGPAVPGVQSPPPQQNGNAQTRGRNVSMMSPVMSPALQNMPMYTSSPVLMHAPAVQVSQSHYIPMGAGRGQLRNDNGHIPMQHPPTTHPPLPGYPPSFNRPTW